MERAKATVGGPLGLALTIMPKDSLGLITAATPPLLRRSGKSKMALASRLYDKPVIIDMEAAMHALAGKVMVGQVLRHTRLTPRRSSTSYGVHGGSKRQQSGRVRLDSIKLWVQIWGLPVPIKTVEMGYILGDKLGKVLTVAHRNKKIIDEYLRIARFCSIPKEIQKPAFSTDIKASNFWSTMQTSSGPSHRQFGLGGRQGDRDLRDSEKFEPIKLPKKVVSVVATTFQKLSVMDLPLLDPTTGGRGAFTTPGGVLEGSMYVSPQAGQVDERVLGSGAAHEGWLTLTDPGTMAG
ncbi:hypothetical protein ZWY2020_039275 [Hordeum vulgare]|nr:hypothetical protein ZWY2020_039275 [Hordeum vulgare]